MHIILKLSLNVMMILANIGRKIVKNVFIKSISQKISHLRHQCQVIQPSVWQITYKEKKGLSSKQLRY
jgi:hypothetical protein